MNALAKYNFGKTVQHVCIKVVLFFTENPQSSTSAKIRYHDIIESAAHIFLEHKLPVSGYLVAWKYYMNTGDVCTNTSYAAIIRRDGDMYRMIARTLLTPEDSTNAGVRFQFVQNTVIRVQKDDLIAAFTENGESSTCNQLVSVDPRTGSSTLTVNLGTNQFNISETKELPRTGQPHYDHGMRQADPALMAFVLGIY